MKLTIDNLIEAEILPLLAKNLYFSDIGRFEEGLGKIHPRHINAMYIALHKRYFPYIEIPKGISPKKFFRDTVEKVLKTIETIEGVKLSPYAFLQAGAGRLNELNEGVHWFNQKEYEWLQGIQYSYYPNTKNISVDEDQEKVMQPIVNAAKFSLCTKNTHFLEKLLYEEGKLLNTEEKLLVIQDMESFFETNKDDDFLEKLFNQYTSLLEQEGKRSPINLLEMYEYLFGLDEDEDDYNLRDKNFSIDELSCIFYSFYNHFDKIKHLLKTSLSPEIRTFVFIEAARHGNAGIIHVLLSHKNPLMRDSYRTGIEEAIKAGQLEMLKLLLGQLPEEGEITISEMLEIAAKSGQLNIVEFFINHPELSLNDKRHAFAQAALGGKLNVLEFLFKHDPKVYTTKIESEMKYVIKYALLSKDLPTINFLLNNIGNNISVAPIVGDALSEAMGLGFGFDRKIYPEIIRILLQYAKEKKISAEVKEEALVWICFIKREEERLIQMKKLGWEPGILQSAVNKGHEKVVAHVLKGVGEGISLQELGYGLCDAMHNIDPVKIVVQQDVVIQNYNIDSSQLQNKAYMHSLQERFSSEKHQAILGFLRQYAQAKGVSGEVIGWALRQATQYQYHKVVNNLLVGMVPESIPHEHVGAAIYAALRKDSPLYEKLMQFFAQSLDYMVEVVGWTLRHAVQHGDAKVVSWLLGDPTLGMTTTEHIGAALYDSFLDKDIGIHSLLLHYIEQHPGRAEIIEWMLESAILNNDVHTTEYILMHEPISAHYRGEALCYAALHGQTAMVALLLRHSAAQTKPGAFISGEHKGKAMSHAFHIRELEIGTGILMDSHGEVIPADAIGALLYGAVAYDETEVVQLLLQYLEKTEQVLLDKHRKTLLMLIDEKGHSSMTERLASYLIREKRPLDDSEHMVKRRKTIKFLEKRPLEEAIEKPVKQRKMIHPKGEDLPQEKPRNKSKFRKN